ncbi:MAG: hypothetical protein IKY27_00350 [Bacteroidales bacterium]|nr:hypothetical protein [Bacteroidales bacterium]
MKKKTFSIIILVIALLVIVTSTTGCGALLRWGGTYYGNTVDYIDHKIDDSTRYETKKKVEDTCRAMIASYESDKLTYEQYKDSDNEEKQSWAEQAKMRANKTASTYNNYILENSYVWSGNIPTDIKNELWYIE